MNIGDFISVEVYKHNLSDASVIDAARVSTLGEDSAGDWTRELLIDGSEERLINYLLRNNHISPFSHGTVTFRVHAPIFVMRELMRHTSWDFNEESGRYRELEPVFHLPRASRPIVQVGKSANYTLELGDDDQIRTLIQELHLTYAQAYDSYKKMLRQGIAREVARMALPVGIYSTVYASCNARSLIHFLQSRCASDAQYEIRTVANKMRSDFETMMPVTYRIARDLNLFPG